VEDVTHLFHKYRECIRQLWNTYYLSVPDHCRNWDLHNEFDDSAVAIFASIVMRPLGRSDIKLAPGYAVHPPALPGFYVTPNISSGTPIMINCEQVRSGYWDHPIRTVTPDDVTLDLVRVFDFDWRNYLDYRDFEVLIRSSIMRYSEVVGRAALIDVEHSTVMFQRPN
jgi:hypothetical protein